MAMDEPFADTIAPARIVIPTDTLPPDQISTLLIMAMGRLQASGMVFQSFASASLPHHYPERVEGLRSRRRLCPVDGGATGSVSAQRIQATRMKAATLPWEVINSASYDFTHLVPRQFAGQIADSFDSAPESRISSDEMTWLLQSISAHCYRIIH